MDLSLTKEQSEWVEKAEALGREFAQTAADYDRRAAYPAENFERLREGGFLKLPVPREYGGFGPASGNVGLLQYLVIETLARFDPVTSWDLVIHFHQTGVLSRLASDEQKRRVFGEIVSRGALMGSLGSEVNPTQYKAPTNTATKLTFDSGLTPVEGGFIANGEKHFCSMGPVADYLLFWALAPGTRNNGEGLTQAFVPKNAPGLTWSENGWDQSIGLRGTVSWSAKLKDVMIPWANVIGQPGDFVQKDPYTYEVSHVVHLVGAAQGVLDFVIEFIRERPYIAKDDVLLHIVAEMYAKLQATRTAMWHAIWMWESQRFDEASPVSIAALYTAKEAALFVANKAFDVCGTRAMFKFHPVERFWRDIRASSLHTRQTQLMKLLGQAVLDGGKQFSKVKYGEKLTERKSWADLGLTDTRPPQRRRA